MNKSLDDFFAQEIAEYSLSVIENRAIPSVIDGLKPSQRKVLCEAFNIWGSGNNPLKVFQFGGRVASNMMYVHGDMSLNACISTMCQRFVNPYPLLEGVGQFGSLRVRECGSPRYVGCHLSDIARSVYVDSDICERRVEEGEVVEPYSYIPILPVLLLNGCSGIATGFACNILPYSLKDVADSCKSYVKSRKDGKKSWKNKVDMKPSIPQWCGDVVRVKDKDGREKWSFNGKYHINECRKKDCVEIEIDEFSKDKEYSSYEKGLQKLVSENDNFVSWSSDKRGDETVYKIIAKSDFVEDKGNADKLRKLLMLDSTETELFVTLDECGKLKIFDGVDDIVKYFCDYRLSMYDKIIEKRVGELESKHLVLRNKVKFITEKDLDKVLKGKKRDEVVAYLKKNKYDEHEGGYSYLLSMNFLNRTKEKADEMVAQLEKLEKQIDELKKTDKYEMFINGIDACYNVLKKM